jgi:hypothetical protein
MPRAAKLKVYRTPIGFQDAYVAAPSQKAAMEAWGSGKDLFTRGEAELVTDPALTAEPLARPGEVVKRLRGTIDEQLAALPPDAPPRRKSVKAADGEPPAKSRKPAKPPAPRPSRDALDAAEQALDAAEARHHAARADLAEREAALAKERRALEQAQSAETERLEQDLADAKATYEAATRKWRG